MRTFRLRAPLLLAAAVAMVAVVDTAAGGGASAQCRPEDGCGPQWTGRYRYAGGKSERKARYAAIDAGTDDMMFIARPIARRRLRSDTKPYRHYELRVTDEHVTIETDVRWTTPLDGTPRRLRDADGDAFDVSTRFRGGHLVQRITDEGLENLNVFSLGPEHQRLRIRIRIEHDRLSGPVSYRLTYRRVR